MADLKIVIADNIKGSGIDLLKEEFGSDAIEVRGKYSEDELCESIGGIDALLIRSGTKVTRKAFESGDRIKIIGRAGVGTDNIDKAAATERGVVVMNTPMGNTVSAAEQAIALLFATARNTARADAEMQKGNWAKKELRGVEVYKKTLGLIGLGKIGSHVAKVMKAAGMTVIASDPFLSPERARHLGIELVEIDALLERSDFVSIHTPLTDKTRNLLSKDNLAKMKEGARLVNCARGGIVDEAALAEAVGSGHLAAAGLDVFSSEPMTGGPLFGVKDLTLTPHLGASTEEAEERCGRQIAEQTVAFFKRDEIVNAVNVQVAVDPELKPYVDLGLAMGVVAEALLEKAPERVEVSCAGQIEEKDTSEITSAVVQGVLRAHGDEEVNVVNAFHFAKERGLEVSEVSGRPAETFLSRVDVTVHGGGTSLRVSGTAYDNLNPRIVAIDDFELDLRPEANILIMKYPDRPGYIGKFGSILAENDINIAGMDVGRTEARGRAVVALTVDERPSDEVVEKIRAVEGVERAQLVCLE
jgi:D-3-phosphoglycerate dehydrogenase / 2-oxoglutarate reductase